MRLKLLRPGAVIVLVVIGWGNYAFAGLSITHNFGISPVALSRLNSGEAAERGL
jgi:hypothetical protein